MIRLLFFCAFCFLFNSSFSQKAKDRYVNFKYLKAPLTPREDLCKNYHFVVTEEDVNAQGKRTTLTVISQTNAYDPRSNFYKSAEGLGQINGFVDKRFHKDSTLFFIKMEVGLLDDGLRQVKEKLASSGSIFFYQIPFRIPIYFSVFTQDSIVFFTRDTKDTTFAYNFPINHTETSSTSTYTSSAALGSDYESKRLAYFAQVRQDLLKKWVYQTKMDFSSHFSFQRTDFNLDLHFIKDKKGEYGDVDLLVVKMDTLFKQLDANYEKSFTSNWHGAHYKDSFLKLAAEWNQILTDDAAKTKSGSTARFDTEGTWGLYKNFLWCKFFAGEMDFVIERCTKLELDRKSNLSIYGGVKFNNMLAIASDYRMRYLANPKTFKTE